MTMALVKDGKVILDYLPSKYELSGQTVSNYHLLDLSTLLAEGWLPLIDNTPNYDNENETLISDGYEINNDNVVKLYKVVDKKKTENERLEERLESTEIALMDLMMEV